MFTAFDYYYDKNTFNKIFIKLTYIKIGPVPIAKYLQKQFEIFYYDFISTLPSLSVAVFVWNHAIDCITNSSHPI